MLRKTLLGLGGLAISSYLSGPVRAAKPDPIIPESDSRTILVIGETGTGKSTFINMMGNYLSNLEAGTVKYDITKPYICIPNALYPKTTERKYNLHSEADIHDRTKAQTQKAIAYTFPFKSTIFKIIDTPGLNDPEGEDKDEKNMEIILKAAEESNELSAIVLVLNGTEARITPNIETILTKLKGSIPDSITNNIVVVYTMCREETCNAIDNDMSKHFVHFNNTAFSSKYDPKKPSNMLKAEWDDSMESCEKLTQIVEGFSNITTNEFTIIQNIRNLIKTKFHECRVKVDHLQTLLDQVHQTELDIKNAEENVNSNSNYTVKKSVNKVEMVQVGYHSTVCAECNSLCHDHCGLDETPTKGVSVFMSCACIDKPTGNCTKCSHSYIHHYHSRQIPQTVVVQVDEEVQALKDKYIAAQQALGNSTAKMSNLEIAQQSIQAELEEQKKLISEQCKKLKKICRNFDLTKEIYLLSDRLKKDLIKIKSPEARVKAEEFIKYMIALAENF